MRVCQALCGAPKSYHGMFRRACAQGMSINPQASSNPVYSLHTPSSHKPQGDVWATVESVAPSLDKLIFLVMGWGFRV